MTVKEGLQAALAALGPNGELWAKGAPVSVHVDGIDGGIVPDGFLCAMTACGAVARATELFKGMRSTLEAQVPEPFKHVVPFNDATETTFADIKALFERAIAATEAA